MGDNLLDDAPPYQKSNIANIFLSNLTESKVWPISNWQYSSPKFSRLRVVVKLVSSTNLEVLPILFLAGSALHDCFLHSPSSTNLLDGEGNLLISQPFRGSTDWEFGMIPRFRAGVCYVRSNGILSVCHASICAARGSWVERLYRLIDHAAVRR